MAYDINKQLSIGMANTMFGEVTITAPESGGDDQVLASKVVTDLRLDYKVSTNFSLNAKINNIFDVYQDETDASTNTAQAATRFRYSSEVQQMGQFGTNFRIGLNYQF